MTTRLSVIDRLVVFLFAVILAALAAPFIGLVCNAQWAHQLFESLHLSQLPTHVGGGWIGVLSGTIAVALLVGVPLVVANLRSHRFSRGTASEDSVAAAGVGMLGRDDVHGRISVEVADLAAAAAQSIQNVSGVEKVRSKVFYDRSEPTMQFTITAKPSSLSDGLLPQLDAIRRSVDDALPASRMNIRYVLEMLPNKRTIAESGAV